MFKFTFLVLYLFILNQCFSQKIDDVLVSIWNRTVSIYNIDKDTEHQVYFFDDDNAWRIIKAEFHDDLFTLSLFNYREFLNFGLGGTVNEINLILDTNNFNLINLSRNRVVTQQSHLNLFSVTDSNIVLLDIIEDTLIYNRYFPKLEYYTHLGNLYKASTSNNDELILEKNTLQKIECGYYELDFSDSLLAVTYRCTKFRNKKSVSDPKIFFYELSTLNCIDFNIEGCCPQFSSSGRYVLYYYDSNYYCYDMITGRKTKLPNFNQVEWAF